MIPFKIKLAVLILTSFLFSGFTGQEICHNLLTNNNTKYWDAKVGYNWVFKTDSTFFEYDYSSKKDGKIKTPDRGDVIMGKMSWHCKRDTLFIQYAFNYTVAYPILKLDRKQLIVKDPKKAWGEDTLFFTAAKKQDMVFEN